jgi:hypothetical protein
MHKQVIKSLLILLLPFIVSLIIGLSKYPLYDVFKDSFYFLIPLAFIMLGYMMARQFDVITWMRSIIFIGSAFSIMTLFANIHKFGINALIDPRIVHDFGAGFGFEKISIVSWTLLVYSLMQYKIRVFKFSFKNLPKILLILNTLAIYSTGYRNNYLCCIIMALIISYPYYKKKISFLIGICIVFIGIGILNHKIAVLDNEMSYSISRSSVEISISDQQTEADINDNYRGYEAFIGMQTYKSWNLQGIILGGGFGTTIDIGNSKLVGLQYLPILHNGYVYILLKGGLLSMLCFALYFFYLLNIFRKYRNNTTLCIFLAHLGIASIIILYSTNLIVTGIFNPGFVIFWMIAGFSLYYNMHSSVTNLISTDNNNFK